jgi:CRP-like cAMP-binding protein
MTPLHTMLDGCSWAGSLPADLRARVDAESFARHCAAGTWVCPKGEPVLHWIGVIDGLVKMTNVSADGKPTMFTGVPTGGWFGEGSLLKDEPRRYDIVALRDSDIACVPRATFLALLDGCVAFNRFVLNQLNERLSQFIALVEYDRLLAPDARLARGLAALFNPTLYPGLGPTLPISQEQLGQLVGLSRQRVNRALKRLQEAGLLRIEYGGVTVLGVDGLREFEG